MDNQNAKNENVTDYRDSIDKPKYSALRQSLPQILAVCVKNCLLLIHGMSLGFPTILIPSITGNNLTELILLNQEETSWIGSINLIFVPLGCLISGSITQAIGRKRAMQCINIPFLAAWLIFHFSTESWHIFVAASMLGFSGGLLEAPVLTYVSEITVPHLRGILSSTSTMSVTLGMLSQFILGTFFQWRTVTLINCIIPIISFVLLMFVPETPIWLISKNRKEEAKESLAWLRGWTSVEDVQEEFQEIYKHTAIIENEHDSFKKLIIKKIQNIKLFTKRSFIQPSLLIAFIFIVGSFNGYSPFQVYAIKIFEAMRVPIDAYYSTIIVGVMQLAGSIVCVTTISFLGKRILNFIALFLCGVCCLVVATYSYTNNIINLDNASIVNKTVVISLEEHPNSWIPTVFLILFGFFAYGGIKVLPFILIGEIFAVEIRAFSSGFSAGVGYVFGFAANKTFLGLVEKFGLPYVFWFYSAVSILGTIALFFILPETEGKTLFEISEHFAGREQLKNSVRRRKKIVVVSNGCHNPAFDIEEKLDKVESKL